jgi:hypothetical protein
MIRREREVVRASFIHERKCPDGAHSGCSPGTLQRGLATELQPIQPSDRPLPSPKRRG